MDEIRTYVSQSLPANRSTSASRETAIREQEKRDLSAKRHRDLEQRYDQLTEDRRHSSAYRGSSKPAYTSEIFNELTPASTSHYLG